MQLYLDDGKALLQLSENVSKMKQIMFNSYIEHISSI